MINVIEQIQRSRIYQDIARLCLKALHPLMRYEVRVPLTPGQSHGLYRVFPADQFDIFQPLQQGKPAIEWMLLLYLNTARTPAACITMIRSPEECPRGKWHISYLGVQIRFRGVGLDKAVVSKAGDILGRCGMAIESEA